MPRGVKTNEKMVQKILSSYALTNSFNATAKQLGISHTVVADVIRKNAEEFGRVKQEKRESFAEYADKLIFKAMGKLDIALDREDIPVNNLTTAIGTLYDKKALAKGESTSNNNITITMDETIKDLSK